MSEPLEFSKVFQKLQGLKSYSYSLKWTVLGELKIEFTILQRLPCNFLISGESICIFECVHFVNIWCHAIHSHVIYTEARKLLLRLYADRKQTCKVRNPRDFPFAKKRDFSFSFCKKRFTVAATNFFLARNFPNESNIHFSICFLNSLHFLLVFVAHERCKREGNSN